MSSNPKSTTVHQPVLLNEVVELLNPKGGDSYLDLTAGWGGHAQALLEQTKSPTNMVLVDRDLESSKYLKSRFKQSTVIQSDFLTAAKQLIVDKQTFDCVLADLGVSSPQLDNAERGFSFMQDGPLDMRMDQSQELTANELVNTATKVQLDRILKEFGQEPHSNKITEAIINSRPLSTTLQLAELIEQSISHRGKKHPATRTFQALRIAVNKEVAQLEHLLPLLPNLLKQEGKVAIISFHSLEDRLVKRFFKEQNESGYESELQLITKRPIKGEIKDVHNPRARSARLRVAVKK